MLLKNIYFKLASSETHWTDLKIQNQSGILHQQAGNARPGPLREVEITAYIPHITPERQALLSKLSAAGGIFLAVTNTGGQWRIGSDILKARFQYAEMDGNKAGSRSGYLVSITLKSTIDAAFKSFESLGSSANIAVNT